MTNFSFGISKKPTIYKAGYGSNPKRTLAEIKYVVYHSAEGWAANIMPIQNDPNKRASWTATVLLDGTLWRHYDWEDVTWTSGTLTANVEGVGIEFEGVKGTPITDAQVTTGALIYEELKAQCPNLRIPVLGQGFEEHRRVSAGATTCPNDRIRWNDIAALINEEDDMTPEEIKQLFGELRLIRELMGHGTFYAGDPTNTTFENAANLPGWFRRHLKAELDKGQPINLNLSEADFDKLAKKVADVLAARLKE